MYVVALEHHATDVRRSLRHSLTLIIIMTLIVIMIITTNMTLTTPSRMGRSASRQSIQISNSKSSFHTTAPRSYDR